MSSAEPTTREKILAATAALLAAGPGQAGAVRMSDVAKKAGLSRQAVYLHFTSRADLLAAATRYIDAQHGVRMRLAASREAKTGRARLDAFVQAWADYLPVIYPAVRALLAMTETDAEAAEAWDARMADLRDGCRAAIEALEREGALAPTVGDGSEQARVRTATDILWTLLSVRNWEHLTRDCGWDQAVYTAFLQEAARRLLVRG
ncbi:MAG: TetR/AcrR family transcriptional regulator [Alphaproteobacteria bacterium]|nr:TetR/AcrR family transcriptional regulator [Alphaproteobacteria bacterium]